MITDSKDLVICLSPVLWILFLLSLAFTILEDLFDTKNVFRFCSYGCFVAFVVVSFMSGAKYQELILFLIAWLLVQAMALAFPAKKKGDDRK
jgi:hypothetical protein